ncbi:OsmC family protein [Streptomyces polyrhachis]|uniref:OsmC family protein n=1 Tax=Streptomyces polyrhachis TaxID=1282885 RepID=A0ABW2GH54_9ACTN
MAFDEYPYDIRVTWTGDLGTGTSAHAAYSRDHEVRAARPPPLAGSADTGTFRGDRARWNPEQLLTAAVAQAHLLWYLHLCAAHGVTVLSYEDRATGVLTEGGEADHFREVVLRPRVVVADSQTLAQAHDLHEQALEQSFAVHSVRFPVRVEPHVTSRPGATA